MNAYELAKEISKPNAFKTNIINAAIMLEEQADWLKEYAIMLDELADRIAELENRLEETRLLYLKELANKAELEKGGEPVAWMSQDVLNASHIIKAIVRREQDEQHNIPLYTTPQTTRLDNVSLLSETSDISIDKPVAWVDFNIEGVPVQLDYEWGCQMQKSGVRVPLYTTPQTKSLTDEEITKTANKLGWSGDLRFLVNFARAIEERHGIK